MPPRRVYWDSCAFLGLLNQEPHKGNDCTAVWSEAQRGETVIVTSFLTWAEVFRAKCEGTAKPLSTADDQRIENLLRQSFIEAAVVDESIGVTARRYMRSFPECKKPTDGIHLATAAALDVDEMHTYDRSDLLGLDGRVQRADGAFLKICKATPIPPPHSNRDLFSEQGDA